MNAKPALIATILLSTTAFSPGLRAAGWPSEVTVKSGKLQGAIRDGVLSFKGIPFAAPPVGRLRWRPPQPVTPWRGMRPAIRYGHDCMQKPFPGDAAPLRTEPSEDCLVLNVWRPADGSASKLPVMVWIYGGGYVNGGTSPAVYEGSQFAKRGIVLVSFNYRLGRFGFFAFPALTRESKGGLVGNYGYMDQIAALKWVQRNIAAFGGDPGNVTVFGESAGGGSVHMLLTSPLAKGLFERAVIESGGGRGALTPMRRIHGNGPHGRASAEQVGVAFAESVGIRGTSAKALAALRALPAAKVTAGLNMASMTAPGRATYVGGPVLDGKIVTETPDKAYIAGRQAKVPLIIGANSADIGFSAAKTMAQLWKPFGAEADKARAVYDPQGSSDVRKIGARIARDRLMIEPARFVAAAFARQGLESYEYRFSYVAGSMRKQWASGAPHASEIPYVFDTVAAKYGDALTAQDEATARAMNAYWANFAKTGNPNGAGVPDWPAYHPSKDVLMDFTAAGPEARRDPLKARLDVTEHAAEAAASR